MRKLLKTTSLIVTSILFLTTASIANQDDDILNFGTVAAGDTGILSITDEECTSLHFHENIKDFFSCTQNGTDVNIIFEPNDNTFDYNGLVYTNKRPNGSYLLIGKGSSDAVEATRLLRFDPQPRGGIQFNNDNTTRQLAIYNDGNSVLTVNNIRFHKNTLGSFSYVDDGWDMTIAANSFKVITLEYNGTPAKGLVYIETDKTNTRERSRLLTGN
jgi:hypothetical protein